MPTSFVEYRGFGFWTRDHHLQAWILAVLREAGELPKLESWEESLKDHWLLQVEIDGGMMALHLDEYAPNETRRETLLCLARKALKNSSPEGRRTGELFIDLLEGKVSTGISSPTDYLDVPAKET
jgi:hypothetical protein